MISFLLWLSFILIIIWFLFWSNLIFYSNPIQLPSSFLTSWTRDYPKNIQEKDKFIIIGAGFSGLALSASFKRHGIPFVTVDANSEIGGNWYNGVFDCTHIISSKKTTEYKDFPMPKSYPDFPSAKQMLDYLKEYVKHNELLDFIELNTKVLNCEKIENDQWVITMEKNGKTEKRTFKGVIVCNGHHWDKRIPSYKGEFKGEIIHSKDFRKPDVLKNKRVLIVGGGNSACDVAVEAARHANSSHISLRRGYWFLPRTVFGIPLVECIQPWIPEFLQRILIKTMFKIVVGDPREYGLQYPDHSVFEHHPTINSELLHFIKLGKITPHTDIKEFEGKKVIFTDGNSEEFDMIVYCTGFNISIPMLKNYVKIENGIPDLIEGAFIKGHKNVYYFGLGQVRYGVGPMVSLGADMISKVVLLQDSLQQDIGTIFEKIGMKPYKKSEKSQDILIDPHTMFKKLIIFRWFLIIWMKIKGVKF